MLRKNHSRSRTTGWRNLLVVALAVAAVGGGTIAIHNSNYILGEKVIDVIDGDTFIIENHQSIRLFGLDAPETENCMGKEAKNALTSLVLGKRVQLRDLKVDSYRRVLALVYINSNLVNELMIRGGFAQYSGQGDYERIKLNAANSYARNNSIGIYSPLCYQREPPDPKCAIKGNVDTTLNKKIYYTPDCPYGSKVIIMKFQGDAWFCSEAEARKAGFTKSETCK